METDFTTDIKQEVQKAIENKETLDGLSGRLYKRLIREIKAFSDKIKVHEPPDVALIAYKGRHWFELGYERRGLELEKALIKQLEGYNDTVKPLEPTTSPTPLLEQNTVGESPKEPQQIDHNISSEQKL